MHFVGSSITTRNARALAVITVLSAPVCYYILFPIFMWNHMLVAGIIVALIPQALIYVLTLSGAAKTDHKFFSRVETHLLLAVFGIFFWNHLLLAFALTFSGLLIINAMRSK